MAMMIPKPTAASAAATVITIKTNNCPETSRKKLENATKVRFTALSISSMHMNIEITLRLIITPTTPIVNRTAESARYHESCGVISLISVLEHQLQLGILAVKSELKLVLCTPLFIHSSSPTVDL